MKNKTLYLFFFIAFIHASTISSQNATRGDLMKLFYQAQQEARNENMEGAVTIYNEIIELEPGLAEPYLHLGAIYMNDNTNEVSLQLAISNFEKYLQLRPNAKNTAHINATILELKESLAQQNALVDNIFTAENVDSLAIQIDVVEKEEVQELIAENVDSLAIQKEDAKKEEIQEIIAAIVDTIDVSVPIDIDDASDLLVDLLKESDIHLFIPEKDEVVLIVEPEKVAEIVDVKKDEEPKLKEISISIAEKTQEKKEAVQEKKVVFSKDVEGLFRKGEIIAPGAIIK